MVSLTPRQWRNKPAVPIQAAPAAMPATAMSVCVTSAGAEAAKGQADRDRRNTADDEGAFAADDHQAQLAPAAPCTAL